MLGLCCFVWAFSSCGEQNWLFTVVRRLVIAVASVAVEHRLRGARASAAAAHRLSTCSSQAQYLQLTGSVLAAHGLSTCSSRAKYLQLTGSVLAAHGLSTCSSRARYLQLTGSVLVAHRLSWPAACGIFLDQGLNLCPLHWQADSYPMHHQGNPKVCIF